MLQAEDVVMETEPSGLRAAVRSTTDWGSCSTRTYHSQSPQGVSWEGWIIWTSSITVKKLHIVERKNTKKMSCQANYQQDFPTVRIFFLKKKKR